MRALFAGRVFIIAGLAGGALAPTAVDAAPIDTAAARTPAARPAAAHPAQGARPANLVPRPLGVPRGSHVQPKWAAPAPLAARPRPGKNAPTTLGGPGKYDAKKGARLGDSVMPHRP